MRTAPPRSSRAGRSLVACLVMPMLLAACVTRSSFDEVAAERDAIAAERDRLAQTNTVLESKTLALIVTTGILKKELALQDLELAQLEQEQRELADEVTRWAILGAVKMALLADGLHVLLPHEVLFESGASVLSPQGERIVNELVAELGQQPYEIAVVGFTDDVPIGPRLVERYPSNWELAGMRAASVVRVMQAAGVPVDQMLAVSRGEGMPIAPNDTPEGRAQNRRIDVRLRPILSD